MTAPDAAPVRPGEELPVGALREALRGRVPGDVDALEVLQFPGGFSNLTYLLRLGEHEGQLAQLAGGDHPVRHPRRRPRESREQQLGDRATLGAARLHRV